VRIIVSDNESMPLKVRLSKINPPISIPEEI
jgi:hypothetical protein